MCSSHAVSQAAASSSVWLSLKSTVLVTIYGALTIVDEVDRNEYRCSDKHIHHDMYTSRASVRIVVVMVSNKLIRAIRVYTIAIYTYLISNLVKYRLLCADRFHNCHVAAYKTNKNQSILVCVCDHQTLLKNSLLSITYTSGVEC